MILLDAQVPIPDSFFYYTLSTLMAAALIWILSRYVNRTGDLLDKLVQNDIKQDGRLDHHEKQIQELKTSK